MTIFFKEKVRVRYFSEFAHIPMVVLDIKKVLAWIGSWLREGRKLPALFFKAI